MISLWCDDVYFLFLTGINVIINDISDDDDDDDDDDDYLYLLD